MRRGKQVSARAGSALSLSQYDAARWQPPLNERQLDMRV